MNNRTVSPDGQNESGAWTVLIVEDSAINLFLTRTIIQQLFPTIHVVEASNGEEAVLFFKKHSPDLVFMDIQMPIKDGYQAAKVIREMEMEHQHTPIIALTAGFLKEERKRCLEVGMDDFLAKPFMKEEIKHMLQQYLFKLKQEESGQEIITTDQLLHFDLSHLRALLNHEPLSAILNIARMALQEIREALQKMLKALEHAVDKLEKPVHVEHDCLIQSLHDIKGLALNMGFQVLLVLTKECRQLNFSTALDNDRCLSFVSRMQAEAACIEAEIEQLGKTLLA